MKKLASHGGNRIHHSRRRRPAKVTMAREKPEPETAREETEEIGDGSSGEGGDRDGGDGEGGDDDGEDAMSEETEGLNIE
ncbi:hypothetical protein R6Q59_026846 [Mikania micrantha]